MENKVSGHRIASGLFWRFAERFGAKFVEFIVSIIVARILIPDDYGTVALVMVFTTIMQVFVDSGLGNALIQKKNVDQIDYSSVFFLNIVFCIVIYCAMFMLAPCIALFYNRNELTPMIRVLSITILISGVKNVQQAYVSRNLLFRKFFFSTLTGTCVAGTVGVIMAYRGYGAWAIVAQQIINLTIDTFVLWLTVPWRPTLCFSINRIKELYKFGWKLLVSALINTIYENLRQLIIGKKYSSADLAYFNKGKQFPSFISYNISVAIDGVLFPVLSRKQDCVDDIRTMTRQAIKIGTYLMAPVMLGLAAVAPEFIELILTEKWLDAVFFMRIVCLTSAFYPLQSTNLNAINALGRSDLFLKLEIKKKLIGLLLLVISMQISVRAMAYSLLITCVFSQIINCRPNKELIGYGYIEQVIDIFPSLLLSCCMALCIIFMPNIDAPVIVVLLLHILFGVVFYVVGSFVFRIDVFYYILNIITNNKKKKSLMD